MLSQAINAERIKLLSTRSPYWCVALVVVIAIAISVVIALATAYSSSTDPDVDVTAFPIGVTQIGVLVLMIMAVLAVTSEFRFGTIRTTFQAIPKREDVFAAKAVVYGGLSAGVTLLLGIVTILLGKLLSGDSSELVDVGGADAIRMYWGIPVYSTLCVLIALGVGALIRQTAGAIVVLLIWDLAVETLLSTIPKVKVVGPYLPFNNGSRFIADGGVATDYPWGRYGSLIYFAVWAIVIFAAGVFVTRKRDA